VRPTARGSSGIPLRPDWEPAAHLPQTTPRWASGVRGSRGDARGRRGKTTVPVHRGTAHRGDAVASHRIAATAVARRVGTAVRCAVAGVVLVMTALLPGRPVPVGADRAHPHV